MPLNIQYKSGARSISREIVDNQNILTRLYAFGSERNLGASYRGGEKRLRFATESNLVANSSFETGDLTSWGQWGSPSTREIVSSKARFGTYSYHHVGSGNSQGSYQTLSGLNTETEYTISGYIYTTSNTSIRITAFAGGPFTQKLPVNFNKWERFDFQLTTRGAFDKIILWLGGEGEAYFDAIQVEESSSVTQFAVSTKSFVEDNSSINDIIERTINFEDVFPHRVGSVIGVGIITKFTDSGMDFDVNDYLISGITAKIHFLTGDLAGYEIEVSSYDDGTKEFTLITYTDPQGFEFPNANLKPTIGDTYTILDITMPTSYITTAEIDLKARATSYLSDNSKFRLKWNVDLDWRYIKENSLSFNIGDSFNLEESDLDVNESLRIIHLERSLTNPDKYRVDLSNFTEKKVLDKIHSDTSNLNKISVRQDVNLNQHTVYINRNADEIDLRVEKDGVINAINISTEGIVIEGTNIQLNGDTEILGTLVIDTGKAGGWFIDETTLTSVDGEIILDSANKVIYVGGNTGRHMEIREFGNFEMILMYQLSGEKLVDITATAGTGSSYFYHRDVNGNLLDKTTILGGSITTKFIRILSPNMSDGTWVYTEADNNLLLDPDGGTVKVDGILNAMNGFKDNNVAGINYTGALTDISSLVIGGGIITTATQSPKKKTTTIGGSAILLTNKTGANSVKGGLVEASDSFDDAVELCAANGDHPIGVFLDAGVLDGSEAWIVINGIADVAMENNTFSTHGNWVRSSITEAGYCDATNADPPGGGLVNLLIHERETGHCFESVSATGEGTHILARCKLQFN